MSLTGGQRHENGPVNDSGSVRTQVDSPIPAPNTEAVAAQDPTTAILAWVWHMRYRTTASFRALWIVSLAFTLVGVALISIADIDNALRWIPLVVGNLLPTAVILSPMSNYRWVRWGLDQVNTHPWRSVPARVLHHGRWKAVIEVVDTTGTPVVLTVRIDPAHLAMITDSVLLVIGRSEWAVLRVPGSRELFPAKVRGPFPAGEAVDLSGTDVTGRWAQVLRDRLLWNFLQIPVTFAVLLVFWWASTISLVWFASCAVLLVLLVVLLSRHRFSDFRLPGLVRAGEWVRVDAALDPWKARRDGTASATATLRFADGTTRTAELSAATVDLLGAIFDNSAVWVAGTGDHVAVGFPGYPLVASARLR
ncbi:hypothetical protein Aglo03_66950 [Actinokineospora globicatena]|uniref:Uncharacterized protein n=1 Tax=Actinokineospora globicatena TaxID=103729 RepID=A0A9W6QWH2_9PSEU|nr:hypothetical protein Aglo03_66950 [Actinokineospora globicatena]